MQEQAKEKAHSCFQKRALELKMIIFLAADGITLKGKAIVTIEVFATY